MMTDFRTGSWVTLSRDAHTIPAGCYRFYRFEDEMMLLTVGPEIVLGLNYSYWNQWLTPATLTATRPTRLKDFLKRYAHNVQEMHKNDYVLSAASMTFCFMSAHYYAHIASQISDNESFLPVAA